MYKPFSQEEKNDGFLKLQNHIKEATTNNKPFFIGRLSGNETRLVGLCLANKDYKHMIPIVKNCSGIHITSLQSLQSYFKIYMNSVHHCNLLGVWDQLMFRQCEDFYNYFHKNIKKETLPAQSMELFHYLEHPEYQLDKYFKNKRILVITSHIETIKPQLLKVEHIFNDKKIFNNNTFILLKPPVTLAGNHNNQDWTIPFKTFLEKIRSLKNDFDIAFVSCGGYGMPTCDYIYSTLGKSCIYNGGVQQLYFGIHGKRWENNTTLQKYINPFWVHVKEEDKPKNYEKLENGCYW